MALLMGLVSCPATLVAQSPSWLWAHNATDSIYDRVECLTTDQDGNVIAAGYFTGFTITFGTVTLHKTSTFTMFLVKYDASGNVVWARNTGGTARPWGVACDPSGNIVITGSFDGPFLTLGTDTIFNAGFRDGFLAKYDAAGNVLWATQIGGTQDDYGASVACDASGNVIVSGCFYSPVIQCGPFTLTNTGSYDIFLIKYDAIGNVLWATSATGAGYEIGRSVTTYGNGDIYITGHYTGTLSFENQTIYSNGSWDVYLTKYSASGTVIWVRNFGEALEDWPRDVVTDPAGNVYIAGSFRSQTLTVDTTTLTSQGFSDIFLAKYDAAGNPLWLKGAGGVYNDEAVSLACDLAGHVYAAGNFSSPEIYFDTFLLINAHWFSDPFLVRYDPDGHVEWAWSTGGYDDDGVNGVAIDPQGNVAIGGYFISDSLQIGPYTLINAGNDDLFTAKLESVITGVEPERHDKRLSVFPNPAHDQLFIRSVDEKQTGRLEIFSITGQRMIEQEYNQATTSVDIHSFSSGIYLIRFTTRLRVASGLFLKQ
jgi:hypothetical protein